MRQQTVAHWINLCLLKVYSGAYKKFAAVIEVDSFEGVLPGGIMAVIILLETTSLLILQESIKSLKPFSMCSGSKEVTRESGRLAWLVFNSNSKGKCHLL